MNQSILVGNRHRTRGVNLRLLRRSARVLLSELLHLDGFCLGIHLVETTEIVRLNEGFLGHKGSTDVITFDYVQGAKRVSKRAKAPVVIEGEIFICLDEAVSQARKFRVSWQQEVARYLVHGVLHLSGYDDLSAGPRRQMKREEDRLLKELGGKVRLLELAKDRGKAKFKIQLSKSKIQTVNRSSKLSTK